MRRYLLVAQSLNSSTITNEELWFKTYWVGIYRPIHDAEKLPHTRSSPIPRQLPAPGLFAHHNQTQIYDNAIHHRVVVIELDRGGAEEGGARHSCACGGTARVAP
jgi:hypothetical protein